ncbi:hypothetical protein HanPSC8_Chr08g0310651 [Helianthus annuus]|nr:hypothetical protein HanPSC8_Chr08g0310651 [Helianthus annuus]
MFQMVPRTQRLLFLNGDVSLSEKGRNYLVSGYNLRVSFGIMNRGFVRFYPFKRICVCCVV